MTSKNRLLGFLTFQLIFLMTGNLHGRMSWVTLPPDSQTGLTIYNSADLTLVKKRQFMTFKKGVNKLEFSWAGTQIDPTSLIFRAIKPGDLLRVSDVTFPKGAPSTLVWEIESAENGNFEIEISYFCAGLSWAGQYLLIADLEKQKLEMNLFIHLKNHSGEDFLNAQTRVVVGKLNLVETIDSLANSNAVADEFSMDIRVLERASESKSKSDLAGLRSNSGGQSFEKMIAKKAKEIQKEGLSEYFLYTIEGEEDLKNGWGKKLLNFKKKDLGFESFYKFDPSRWGMGVRRYFRFKNDKPDLGLEPLPDGKVMVYGKNSEKSMEYLGEAQIKYIPIKEKIDLDLGLEKEVTLEKRLVDYRTEDFRFDYKGRVNGWNIIQVIEYEIRNRRPFSVGLELKDQVQGKWDIQDLQTSDSITPVKEDAYTLKYDLKLAPRESLKLKHEITIFQGKNGENR